MSEAWEGALIAILGVAVGTVGNYLLDLVRRRHERKTRRANQQRETLIVLADAMTFLEDAIDDILEHWALDRDYSEIHDRLGPLRRRVEMLLQRVDDDTLRKLGDGALTAALKTVDAFHDDHMHPGGNARERHIGKVAVEFGASYNRIGDLLREL